MKCQNILCDWLMFCNKKQPAFLKKCRLRKAFNRIHSEITNRADWDIQEYWRKEIAKLKGRV